MQESNLIFNILSTNDIENEIQSAAKLVNESSAAKVITQSSTKFNKSSAEIISSAQFDMPKKYIRKGDKVYQANPEHIHMMGKKITQQNYNGKKKHVKDNCQVDKAQSGESLYKTFSFEQSSNNDDTEKCIEFWRAVMEKNLAPIKCSIIEQNQNVMPVLEEPVESKEIISGEVAKIHEDYKNMVGSVLKDLQKKRLHAIKLYGARCKLCETLSSNVSDTSKKVGSKTNNVQAEISGLDNWTPYSKEKEKAKSKTPIKKTIQKRDAVPSKMNDEIEPQNPDNKLYRHIDVIEQKTKNGVYTAWRQNKVKQPCACGNLTCDCNTNPAILSTEIDLSMSSGSYEEVDLPGSLITVTDLNMDSSHDMLVDKKESRKIKSDVKLQKPTEEHIKRESNLSEDRTELSSENLSNEGITYIEHNIQDLSQSVSFVVHCNCGSKNCDCERKKVTISKSKITETETQQLIKPTKETIITVTSSLAITEKTVEDAPRIKVDSDEKHKEDGDKHEKVSNEEDDCNACENDNQEPKKDILT